jgi:Rieske Fe-S protein
LPQSPPPQTPMAQAPAPRTPTPRTSTARTSGQEDATAAAGACCGGATRRTVLSGIGVAGAGLALAACSSSSNPSPAASGGAGSTGSPAAATDSALGPASDVPVGGGTIYKDAKVVVTQPKAGEYKAFTAVCTHAGCLVGAVANGTINCPCHGSEYSITDGSVVRGPAPSPLAGKAISVKGGTVTLT